MANICYSSNKTTLLQKINKFENIKYMLNMLKANIEGWRNLPEIHVRMM
jgi:hypothetical protein